MVAEEKAEGTRAEEEEVATIFIRGLMVSMNSGFGELDTAAAAAVDPADRGCCWCGETMKDEGSNTLLSVGLTELFSSAVVIVVEGGAGEAVGTRRDLVDAVVASSLLSAAVAVETGGGGCAAATADEGTLSPPTPFPFLASIASSLTAALVFRALFVWLSTNGVRLVGSSEE